jgi:Predicted Peptidoglycan domain
VAALSTFLTKRAPHGEPVLMKALEALQGERYLDLAERRPANEAFLYGWLANRIG